MVFGNTNCWPGGLKCWYIILAIKST
jgi:hypothetical protein